MDNSSFKALNRFFYWGIFLCLPAFAETVYFSPKGGITDAIVSRIHSAKKEVLMQTYTFTSAPIITALCSAKQRGVDVEVIADKSNLKAPKGINEIKACGIAVFIDSAHAIAHNKVIVVDEETVLTGSFNYTKGAETSNAENELIINLAPLAKQYKSNWQVHLGHSTAY